MAFCYWAGKTFEVDLNNLKTLAWARPQVGDEFVKRIESCAYAMLQLDEDWEEGSGPFTDQMIATIKRRYAETRKTDSAVYWTPSTC